MSKPGHFIPAHYQEAWNGAAAAGTHGDVAEEVCRRLRDFFAEIHYLQVADLVVTVTVTDSAGRTLYTFRDDQTETVADPPESHYHDEG